jgi:hypothetical protein
MADFTALLNKLYNDASSPAGFAGVDQLWREAKKRLPHIPRAAIENFLEGSRTYTLTDLVVCILNGHALCLQAISPIFKPIWLICKH